LAKLGAPATAAAGSSPQGVAAVAAPDVARAVLREESEGGDQPQHPAAGAPCEINGKQFALHNGAVVIAAITSCTNTSNPSVMLAAGLLARNAVAAGLTTKPWVKSSMAPGSKVVTDYLRQANVLDALGQLLHLHVRHGPVLAGGPHTLDHLGAVERLTQAAPLHHPQRDLLHPFERREAAAAPEALAAAADGPAVLGLARIHDAVVIDTAPWTTHTADDSQGMKTCSPGTTTVEPTSRASCPASEAGCEGSARVAMEASVSPAITTYSCPGAGAA